MTLYKAMRDAVDPAKRSVLCGLGGLQSALPIDVLRETGFRTVIIIA